MTVSSRLRGGALVGGLALVAGLAFPTQALAAEPLADDTPVTLDRGHIDAFYFEPDDSGDPVLSLRDDTGGSPVLRDPSAVDMIVKGDAYSTDIAESVRPEGAPESYYHLPATPDSNLIWPGWDTSRMQSGFGFGASVDIEISDLQAPEGGEVYLYQAGGASLLAEGDRLPNTLQQSFLTHQHADWAFTEPGTYTFTAQATFTSEDGSRTATSDSGDYTFTVAAAPESVSISGAEDEVEPGSEVTLTATQAPEGANFASHTWESRASEDAEWETVEGETGATLTVDAVDGRQYRATVSGGKDYQGGAARHEATPINVTSDPVTISTSSDVETQITIEGLADAYEIGDVASLTAVQDPDTGEDHWHWYIQREDDESYSAIDGALTSELEYEIVEGDHGARIQARLFDHDHEVIAASEAVTLNVPSETSEPEYDLSIDGLAGHYHQGTVIDLTANADPAVDDGSYRWYVQRVDQDEPVLVEGAAGERFQQVAEQALNGAVVTAELLDADGEELATDEVTIEVDDHGADPHQVVSIDGLADHYHSGDRVELTASADPESVLDRYEWYVQRQGEDEPVLVEGENGASYAFDAGEELNGAQVTAVLTYDNGDRYVASEPVVVTVDDHDDEPAPETTLSVEGLAAEYQVGDTASLQAVQDPETGEDHYHWFIQRAGDEEFGVVSGALTDALEHEVAEGDDGAQIKAVLYDHDHNEIAESDPVTLNVAGNEEPAPETELSIEGLADEYQVGDIAELTAVQDPATGEDHYHWFIQRADEDGFTALDGALTEALAYEVKAGDDGAQIEARLYDHDHNEIAASEAVILNVADDPGQDPGDEDEDRSGGSDEGGNGGSDDDKADQGGLADTGVELSAYLLGATLLLAAGAAAVYVARRRGQSGAVE